MKIIKLGILGVLLSLMNACKNESNFSSEIDSLIKKDTMIYASLTNAYGFKFYEDGIGQDLSKPIRNDSIIFLKNNSSKQLNLKAINKGKCILLDSTEICNISLNHDKKEQVMRSFVKIVSFDSPKGIVIEIKNWVPQFLEDNLKCIELESKRVTIN